jgi:hypothetical protein
MVDIAFPTKRQGRHLREVISELNAPPALPATIYPRISHCVTTTTVWFGARVTS